MAVQLERGRAGMCARQRRGEGAFWFGDTRRFTTSRTQSNTSRAFRCFEASSFPVETVVLGCSCRQRCRLAPVFIYVVAAALDSRPPPSFFTASENTVFPPFCCSVCLARMSWFRSSRGNRDDDDDKYGGGRFGGGGFDYERVRRERQEAAKAEQKAIDAIEDPAARRAANRKRYACGAAFVTLDAIPTWASTGAALAALPPPHSTKGVGSAPPARSFSFFAKEPLVIRETDVARRFPVDAALNAKVSVWQGNITTLEIDGIVNAANDSLLGGGGIDGAIHSAAGNGLYVECAALNGCPTGNTKITRGYCLPARHVLHTVGPIGSGDRALASCYQTCIDVAVGNGLRTIAFCCVGTGIFGFPLVRATHLALGVVRRWLDVPGNRDKIDRFIFCTFQDVEQEVYERVLPSYFPVSEAFPASATDVAPFAPEREDSVRGSDRPPRD